MEFRRFYKLFGKNLNIDNTDNYFILLDNKIFKRPIGFPLNKILNKINIFKKTTQDKNPTLPPNTEEINLPLTMAIDDNYLYIWIESQKRWKRILLSNWK